jgi:hypothetical protein
MWEAHESRARTHPLRVKVCDVLCVLCSPSLRFRRHVGRLCILPWLEKGTPRQQLHCRDAKRPPINGGAAVCRGPGRSCVSFASNTSQKLRGSVRDAAPLTVPPTSCTITYPFTRQHSGPQSLTWRTQGHLCGDIANVSGQDNESPWSIICPDVPMFHHADRTE